MLSPANSFFTKAGFTVGFTPCFNLFTPPFRTIFTVISGVVDKVRPVRVLGQVLKLQYVFISSLSEMSATLKNLRTNSRNSFSV